MKAQPSENSEVCFIFSIVWVKQQWNKPEYKHMLKIVVMCLLQCFCLIVGSTIDLWSSNCSLLVDEIPEDVTLLQHPLYLTKRNVQWARFLHAQRALTLQINK